MKIRILCEGPSDEDGVKKLLRSPALGFVRSGAALDVRNMTGVATVFRKIGAYVQDAIVLDGVNAVFALVDLVGSQPHLGGAQPTSETVRDALRQRVEPGHRGRFHPHVAVHEIEAWVFADEATLGKRLRSNAPSHGEPEKINLTRGPANRLNELYMARLKRGYKKTTELPVLLASVNPRVIYGKCPHFKEFLDDLAKAAGLPGPFVENP